MGMLELALIDAELAIQCQSDYGEGYFCKAQALLRMGAPRDAQIVLRKALELAPHNEQYQAAMSECIRLGAKKEQTTTAAAAADLTGGTPQPKLDIPLLPIQPQRAASPIASARTRPQSSPVRTTTTAAATSITTTGTGAASSLRTPRARSGGVGAGGVTPRGWRCRHVKKRAWSI